MKRKLLSAADAVALIDDAATVLVDGSGGGVNEPDLVLTAIAQRHQSTGHPRGLTIIHPSGMGDGHGGGIDRLADPRLVRAVIGGHWGWATRMQQLAADERIAAWCLPQGVISHLLRDIAAGRPGVVTHIGLGTFVDPRDGAGCLNGAAAAQPARVELIELAGREWLFYPALPIDVAVVRGTVADEAGNLTMEDEGLYAETLPAAQAAKNSGGIVIAQVKHVARTGTLDPRHVRVPGVLVDAVVEHPAQRLSAAVDADPVLAGRLRVPLRQLPALPLTERKVIARRAAAELARGDIVNLGFGMPDGVAAVLAEEGLVDEVTFTVEQGHIGGVPATGINFGLARNQHAMVSADQQFDWYDGGGLDIAVLSFAQVDVDGNVNVGKFAGKTPGVGGFVNISQGARRVVFVGTLTRRGRHELVDGTIRLGTDDGPKFVERVEQVSFSGAYARRAEQAVTFVTEAAVLRLTDDGLVLTEAAPGLDVDGDLLPRMGLRPRVARDLRRMDPELYRAAPMGLKLREGEVDR